MKSNKKTTKNKSVKQQKITIKNVVPNMNDQENPTTFTLESLMPELEELVKKNPNKLIGCGG